MSEPTGEVVVFVEDPGSANFVIGLEDKLRSHALNLKIFAAGTAVDYLRQRGEKCDELADDNVVRSLFEYRGLKAVLVGTSENKKSVAFKFTAEARIRDIPSVGIVDAEANPEFRFLGESDNPLQHVPDYVLVPSEETKQRFLDLGLSPSRLQVVGNPRIDAAIKARSEFSNYSFEQNRREIFGAEMSCAPILVFASEISDGLDPSQFRRSESSYTLTGRGNAHTRTHIVLEEVLDALKEITPQPHLVVRLHPKESDTDFEDFRDEIKQFSVGGDPLRTLYFADVVVGLTSTILLEAAAMGLPVVSIVPREVERDWVPSLGGIEIPSVTRRSEIVPALQIALTSKRKKPALSKEILAHLAHSIAVLAHGSERPFVKRK